MVSRFQGKVAFITGAARGQGRSHALRLAAEGANILAFDLCEQIKTVQYPMSTPEDLAQTVQEIEALGRQAVGVRGDVRDMSVLQLAVERARAELGGIDIVLANAGILATTGPSAHDLQAWRDSIDVMLSGTFYTLSAVVPLMIEAGRGGSIVITNSTAGLRGVAYGISMLNPGELGYGAAKHGLVGLVRNYARALGSYNIRVNGVYPSGVRTPMVVNDFFSEVADNAPPGWMAGVLGDGLVEPEDVSGAVAWLCSEEARFVTGVTLSVDRGSLLV